VRLLRDQSREVGLVRYLLAYRPGRQIFLHLFDEASGFRIESGLSSGQPELDVPSCDAPFWLVAPPD
jgi:hypothetical protein